MRKKLISLLLSLGMICSFCTPSFAAGGSMNNFKQSDTYNNIFTDVAATHWSAPSVKTCYEYGLMKGNSAVTFNPSGNLTVAQALVMADRVHEIYKTGSSTLQNGSPWYQPYVDYAVENGIINADTFTDYNAMITRAQMAQIFFNALPASELSAINTIADVPDIKGIPQEDVIMTLYRAGVLTGSDIYGTFYPQKSITRAEAAAIIARIAIPSQRKNTELMDKFTWPADSSVTIAMPETMIDISDSTGITSFSDERVCVVMHSDYNPEYSGLSISEISASDLDAILTQAFSADGCTFLSAQSSLVGFGDIKSYRTTGRMTINDLEADCTIYTYIAGSRMNMISYLSYDGSDIFKTMVNNITVGGRTPVVISNFVQAASGTATGSVSTQTPVTAAYIGHKETLKFHHSTCAHVKNMNESNKVGFNTREEALNKGYVACKVCKP